MANTHKAWRLHAHNDLRFDEVETPKPAPDGVLVRIEAAMVLSYTGRVLSGSVPYSLPPMPFVPGTNAIARVIAAGDNVSHVQSGDRVFLSPHLRGDVPEREPPQILIGLTATVTTPAALAMQMRWRDGVFAEIAHWPAACVTPLAGLDDKPASELIGLAKLIVPFGGLQRAGLRGGRLVLMGSAEVPLEISFREMLANDWEVVGQFMYERTAPGQLAGLAADGLLDLKKIVVTTFKLADFRQAVAAAALMQGLDLTAVVP